MDWRAKLSGLYAILDANDRDRAQLLVSAESIGATALQLRIKPDMPLSTQDLLDAAHMARDVTRAHGALLIIDDRLDIALAADADGVHLGQQDMSLLDVRSALARANLNSPRRELLIGISTHNLDQVRAACNGGADYLGFGPVFDTPTKANPDPTVGLDSLRAAVTAAVNVPVVAIGGIQPNHAAAIAATGAAAAAAISSVLGAADPIAAGRAISAAFSPIAP